MNTLKNMDLKAVYMNANHSCGKMKPWSQSRTPKVDMLLLSLLLLSLLFVLLLLLLLLLAIWLLLLLSLLSLLLVLLLSPLLR